MKKRELFRVFITITIVSISIYTTYYYTQVNKIKTYTVTFDSNGGTKIKTKKVSYKEKVDKPMNPQKEGYTFVEWTYLGETYDFNTKVEYNLKLKATWKEIPKEESQEEILEPAPIVLEELIES